MTLKVGWCTCGSPYFKHDQWCLITQIAGAIEAERARCASIANERIDMPELDGEFRAGYEQAAREIHESILGGR